MLSSNILIVLCFFHRLISARHLQKSKEYEALHAEKAKSGVPNLELAILTGNQFFYSRDGIQKEKSSSVSAEQKRNIEVYAEDVPMASQLPEPIQKDKGMQNGEAAATVDRNPHTSFAPPDAETKPTLMRTTGCKFMFTMYYRDTCIHIFLIL